MEDLETVNCFFEDQETGLGPKNIMNAVVDYSISEGSEGERTMRKMNAMS